MKSKKIINYFLKMKTKQIVQLKKINEDDKDSKKVDFTKEYKNGHKFFDAPQSQAYKDILHKEELITKNLSK